MLTFTLSKKQKQKQKKQKKTCMKERAYYTKGGKINPNKELETYPQWRSVSANSELLRITSPPVPEIDFK